MIFVKYKGRADIGYIIKRVGDRIEVKFSFYKIIDDMKKFDVVEVDEVVVI